MQGNKLLIYCGFTNQKFEKEVLIAGPFPSLPNNLSLFASFPFPSRSLPGRANQSEAARVHGSAPRSADTSPLTNQRGACTEKYDFYHFAVSQRIPGIYTYVQL